ncbi:MAG: glycosyltransferase [Ornithinimicrobium sp.]
MIPAVRRVLRHAQHQQTPRADVEARGEDRRLSDQSPDVAAARGADPVPVTAAVCAGPRLAHLLAPEWRQVDLPARSHPGASDIGIDLVLLEVCHGTVPGWAHGERGLDRALRDCVERGIPVVAWCTDSLPVSTSWWPLVTTVAASTAALREELQHLHDAVLLLPAAAQPRVHRPWGPSRRRQGALVVIDGFAQLEDDHDLVDVLGPGLSPMTASDLRLIRIKGKSSWVTLPSALSDRVEPSREWADLENALGDCRVGVDLSAASVAGPWTTMALACAGVALVGATGLTRDLPDEVDDLVPRRDGAKTLRGEIVARVQQQELADREGHLLQRAVLSGHTARHRVHALLTAAGIDTPTPRRSVSAVVPTNRVEEIDNVLANLARQSHDETELVLVLHGLDLSEQELAARAADAGVADLSVVHADATLTLGACMNLGVDASSGRYIAKMDDDNFYGEHYLKDLVHAFDYTNAGIVGKWCHYVWLRSTGAVVLRYPDSEHSLERRVQGGSMMFDAGILRSLRFSDIPRAVDSDILDRAASEGVQIYSADRFNFVSMRGADRHAHTWTVEDSTFLTKTGRLVFYGDPRPHVSV